jgi:hypothetical protein
MKTTKKKPVKPNKTKKFVLPLAIIVALLLFSVIGFGAYGFYANNRPEKILSDAVSNSADLVGSQDNSPKRFLISYEPDNLGSNVGVSFDIDGQANGDSYQANLVINASLLRLPIELKGDVVGKDDKYYLRLKDLESSIAKAETTNPEFSLYSSYAKDIAAKLEGKWIILTPDKTGDCLSEISKLRPSSFATEKLNALVDTNNKDDSIIKNVKNLGLEDAGGVASHHMRIELANSDSEELLKNIIGIKNDDLLKSCKSGDLKKFDSFDVWVSKDKRQFKKISVGTKSGVYSIELANSKYSKTEDLTEVPTDFTTVDNIKKELEQIIGTTN